MLVLHYDLTLPKAAVAVLRLQRLADAGRAVAFSGVDVLGVDAVLPATLDQLSELTTERERAAALGLDLRRPTVRPPTLSAHLVGLLAEEQGLGAAWRLTCLRRYWTDGVDLADHAVLGAIAESIGLEAASVTARLADRAARDELRARMLSLRALGIGGVPVLEVAGTLLPADVDDAALDELTRV
jgi:predicted DsbA family dithiol-disulfide isomerase